MVLILAGPGAQERPRVADLVESVRAFAAPEAILVVDDAPPRAWPVGTAAIANPRRGRGIGTLGGTCAGTLAGLAWIHANHPGAWTLRLDSDALVVGPYAERVEARLAPGVGILGCCARTPNGQPRDVSAIARDVRRHERAVWAFRHPPRRPWYVRPADRRTRHVLRAARGHGYRAGEHCIAAGCAISSAFVAAAAARGWLEDPRRWIAQRLGDDMLLGAMVRAAGLGLVDAPEVFGVSHVGLPDTAERIGARGFAVVHSLKNDARAGEDELRATFAAARAGTEAGA